ncbi:serine/threonine-protein kinase pim-2-like [Carassius auratus]|uniref:non-specific serine/threonine protein kinase n=1 Tax=Carassius auratus TaxID=7957 RepID=A0A6P6ITF6_CARAU|nr:serine/threonine-protein kinase pim-2-like [Carassius auratus]
MGLLIKALNRLRTLLKRTPQPHPDQDNETPVGACVADVGGGSEAGKEKNKRERKRFWRWHLRRKKYSVAKAEKLYQTSVLGTGTYRRHSQSLKELTPTAEYTEDVLQPAVLDISVCSSAGKGTDSPVHLSDDDSFVSAVTSIAHSAIACAVADEDIASAESLIVHQDVNSAVRPKAERDVASVQHSKIDGGIALAVLPKEDGGIASARHPQVDMGIASAVCTPVDSVATGELDKDHICWRYKFGGRLGEGGFGSVRKGTRVKDGLKVAVKYVKKTKHTKYITTAFHPKPLPVEIALAVIIDRKPSCPHIIEMLDWQDDPDYYLIVMERPVPSMDMAKLLKCSGGRLKEQIAQYIMWQVIYAANFCCNRGVFHRDIKLENVLVNPTTLEIKLIDFGCGNLVKDSGYSTCYGTKPYIPPEYHDRGRYHAKPATVYSLGVLLFTMLHGRFPKDRDLYCLGSNQSVFAVSQECIQFLWACLQCYPEHRIALEQMIYHDWFVLGFPNALPIYRKASKQHSRYR